MSRLRIGSLSCSLYLVLLPFMACMAGLGGAALYARESDTPEPVPIGRLARNYVGHSYIRIQGTPQPGLALELRKTTREDLSTESHVLVAVADTGSRGAIMVELADGSVAAVGRKPRAFEGMLEYAKPELSLNLPPRVAGVPLNHEYYLKEGETPGNPLAYGAVGIAGLLVLLPAAVAMGKCYVVFRRRHHLDLRAPGAASVPPVTEPILASGEFRMGESGAKRFLAVPALVSRREDAVVAIIVQADARSMRGQASIPAPSGPRLGLWSVAFRPEQIAAIFAGEQYLGGERWPALQVLFYGPWPRPLEVVLAKRDRTGIEPLADVFRATPSSTEMLKA